MRFLGQDFFWFEILKLLIASLNLVLQGLIQFWFDAHFEFIMSLLEQRLQVSSTLMQTEYVI